MSIVRRVAFVTFACVLAACTQPAPKQDPTLAKEDAAVAPLKAKYKDVITGTEVRDRTLIMYVEPNAMYSMDEDAEAAMKADALQRFKVAWTRTHPHRHAVLRLDVRDYFGRELNTLTTSV